MKDKTNSLLAATFKALTWCCSDSDNYKNGKCLCHYVPKDLIKRGHIVGYNPDYLALGQGKCECQRDRIREKIYSKVRKWRTVASCPLVKSAATPAQPEKGEQCEP